LVPASDSSVDAVGIGAFDGSLEIDARAGQALGELATKRSTTKEADFGVSRPIEPDSHPGVLVAALIVEHEVDELGGRDPGLDRIASQNASSGD